MNRNTCLLYNGVNEIYDKLLLFCIEKGFKVEESNEKFYFLNAKKKSFLFWRTVRLELEILTVEKEKVQVKIELFKYGKRQPKLENEYIVAIENLF
ncbi:MAG: hypothetical protein ABIT08_07535 [Bacteroidia bacterium]